MRVLPAAVQAVRPESAVRVERAVVQAVRPESAVPVERVVVQAAQPESAVPVEPAESDVQVLQAESAAQDGLAAARYVNTEPV